MEWVLGVNKWALYVRMGRRRTRPIQWHRKGRPPVLGEEQRVTNEKAALASESRWLKSCQELREGDSQ